MSLEVRVLRGAEIGAMLGALARLRTEVFRDWPYLYDGDPENERGYLAGYGSAQGAVLVAAFEGAQVVGAATAMPLADHGDAAQLDLPVQAPPVEAIYYCAESVLLPAYRGQGLGHRFFDLREAAGRAKGFAAVGFASVLRPEDHPLRPKGARSHEAFWRGRGYAPLPGALAEFTWTDVGEAAPSSKRLQFWMKAL